MAMSVSNPSLTCIKQLQTLTDCVLEAPHTDLWCSVCLRRTNNRIVIAAVVTGFDA